MLAASDIRKVVVCLLPACFARPTNIVFEWNLNWDSERSLILELLFDTGLCCAICVSRRVVILRFPGL